MRKNDFLEGYKTVMGVELTKEELIIGAALVAGFIAFLVVADYIGRMVASINF